MLIDLPAALRYDADPLLEQLAIMTNGRPTPLRVHRGIYLAHVNFDHNIDHLIAERYPDFNPEMWKDAADSDWWFNCYGVVDHWTQLPLKLLEMDPRKFTVYLGQHVKNDQPETGGWRWHKWGPYLGVFREQVATHEYLYETPDVVEVFSYSICEMK